MSGRSIGLSKKNKRKRQKPASLPSKIVFTLPAVRMLKDGLSIVENNLVANTRSLPNRELATNTLEGLKFKLEDMLQREEWDKEVGLDYNEMHMLNAAIHMHLVNLSLEGKSALVTPCLELCKQFALLMEKIEGE
jgi:hypothetical protein